MGGCIQSIDMRHGGSAIGEGVLANVPNAARYGLIFGKTYIDYCFSMRKASRVKSRFAEKQYCCQIANMKATLTITSRGIVTLPTKLRQALGLKADDQLIAETTPEGLLVGWRI